MAACSNQCRSYKTDVQDLTFPCLMQLDNSMGYSLRAVHKKWTFAFTWSTCWARCYVPRCYKQVVVPNCHYKFMCAALKLQDNYQWWCYLYDDTSSLEALPTTVQENKDEHSDNNMWTLKSNCKLDLWCIKLIA